MVHLKTFGPAERPETTVPNAFGFAKTPEPETTVHKPVYPAPGSFPAIVAMVPQRLWLGPAFANNPAEILTVYSSISPKSLGPVSQGLFEEIVVGL